MSLYFDTTAVAALGLLDECRNDDGGSVVTFDDAPGAGAGGDADASPAEATTDSTPQDAVSDDAAARAARGDEDDEDADDPDLRDETYKDRPWKDDPAFKRALTRGRRSQRKLAAARPLLDKVRAFGLNAESLDQLVNNARRYQDAEPTLRRLARGEDVSRAADPRQSDRHEVPQFDRNTVPFDPNDPGGRWMIEFAERQHHAYHNVVGAIQALMGEVTRLNEERQSEHRTREVTDWRTEITRAGEQLPEDYNGLPLRQLFSDAVVGAFHQARVRRERINPRAVIQHYLKKYKATKTDPAAAAAAAAQQRMAEASKKRPSSGAFAGGSPTGARDIQNERVSDVNRRIGGRRYLGPR